MVDHPSIVLITSLLLLLLLLLLLYSIIAAKRQHWLQHKQWMYRHVGLGMWVSIHRVIVLTMCPSVSSPPTAQQLASNAPQGKSESKSNSKSNSKIEGCISLYIY